MAAFARFTLELLALAAPSELVEASQRALGDEIAHAKLCFGLASSYRERAVGPGPLPLEGALDASSVLDIATRAFLEACIGETLAAVEARAQLALARDPSVRAVLERIAEDEARHAELGWRFLKWLLSSQPSELKARLRDNLETLLKERVSAALRLAPADSIQSELMQAHGLLSEQHRRNAHRDALLEICVPCFQALFGESAARAA